MPANHRHVIEQQCRQQLLDLCQHLDLTGVQTMTQLCQVLAAWRQRPIHLIPQLLPPGLTGLWLAEDDADTIVYVLNAPQTLADQAIGHELAHLLCGHQTQGHAISASLLSLFTCIAPERIQWSLHHPMSRTTYEADEEYEAEYFASLLEQMLAIQRADAGHMTPSERAIRSRLVTWTNELRGLK